MKLRSFFFFLCLFFLIVARNVFGFPSVYPTGTTIYDPGNAYEGYTLYHAAAGKRVLLINMRGNIIHYWEAPDPLYIEYAEPLSNGNLLAYATVGECRILIELDWNSNPVWEFHDNAIVCLPGEFGMHHDFERLESGNTLILCRDYRDVPEISPNTILDDYIIEVSPEGEIVWEWRTSQHFNEFGFGTEAKEMISIRGGDWAHTNSMQTLPENPLGVNDPIFQKGNILVSQRNTNTIFIIDRSSGDIAWKIGPGNNLTIGQHDAKMISNGLPGAGNILVLDNGGLAGYPPQVRLCSRVIEIEPLNKEIAWQYNALKSNLLPFTFFTNLMGGQQRLPNGNTLIDEAVTGRFFEVTEEGQIVWEYVNPFFFMSVEGETNSCYRIWRVRQQWLESQIK